VHFILALVSYLLPIQVLKGGGAPTPPVVNALLITDGSFFLLTDGTDFLLAQ
jgi:hypothetical protein